MVRGGKGLSVAVERWRRLLGCVVRGCEEKGR